MSGLRLLFAPGIREALRHYAEGPPALRLVFGPRIREALRDYSQGPLALVPALVLLLTIRAYGESGAWGSRQVLALGLGMTLSVLATTGFVHGVNRRASICFGLGDVRSATRFLCNALVIATISVGAFGFLVVLVTSRLGLFSTEEVLTLGLAFLGLSAIWLVSAGLSLMRASAWLGVALAAGLAAGATVGSLLTTLPAVQLTCSSVVGFVTTMGVLAWSTRRALRGWPVTASRRATLPAAGYLVSEATPYFAHGVLYALLYFIPHVFAWLAALDGREPRLLSMANFEAGMTLAMPPFILAGGLTEHTLQQFWRRALVAQINTSATDARYFETTLRAFYRRQLVTYLVVLAGLMIVAAIVFDWALATGVAAALVGLDRMDLVRIVFLPALIVYWLFGWGLFNCMFAVTLARPNFALQAVMSGLGAAVLVGTAAQLLGAGNALLAALVGSAVYALTSSWTTARLFHSLHYYYATAF